MTRVITTRWTLAESDLDAIWTVLATEARHGPVGMSMFDSPFRVDAGAILLAIDQEGRRTVLVPLGPGESFAEDTRGSAVQFRKTQFGEAEYLAASCLLSELDSIFSRFVWEMLNEVARSDQPAATALEVLDRWRRLFAEVEISAEMSRSQVVGLFGELLVLEEILRFDPRRDAAVWTGPLIGGGIHDFRRGGNAVEVKTTLSRGPRVISISSVDQLEAPELGSIYLEVIQLGMDESGVSLPELVDRVSELGPDRREFEDRLLALGYSNAKAAQYADLPLKVVEQRLYEVCQVGFPRIVRSSFKGGCLPAGTLDLTYSIDLTNEPPIPLGKEARREVMMRMAGSS